MNITLIFSTIMAVANAIPSIKKMIDDFYLFYVKFEISKLDAVKIENKQKRAALFEAIKKAGNNEDRKALSLILSDILSNTTRDV
jgi:hypothetical protein